MNAYELKKLQAEFKRVNSGREDQELKIMECEEQIKRIQASIEISIAKEQELLAKIEEAKK